MSAKAISPRLSAIVLLVCITVAVVAMVASAQDEEAPRVAGPADVPGADVVWYDDQAYTLDATGSTDNVGIVGYRWEVVPPTGPTVEISSTGPTATWTPTDPGLYKVISFASDAAGNEAGRVFVVDVVEVLSAQTISDPTVTYDHSVAITDGELRFSGTAIDLTGGLAHDPPSFPTGEMMTESLTYTGLPDGTLAGSWGPYGPTNGIVFLETSRQLIGKAAIGNSGSSTYGFTFTFDNLEDLTRYNHMDAWFMSDYASGSFSYAYFYDSTGVNYKRVGPPTSSITNYGGKWYGVTIPLDISNVDNIATSGSMTSLSAVKSFKLYFSGSNLGVLVDGVTFSIPKGGDNITESATPTGPWAGSWVGLTTGSTAYIGSGSIYKRIAAWSPTSYVLTYAWNTAVDLSSYNAIRLYTWFYTGATSGGYLRDMGVKFTDADGDSSLLSVASMPYLHMYDTDVRSHWSGANIPFDKAAYVNTGTMDWTRVSKMDITVQSQSLRTGDLYIDGLEFFKAATFRAALPVVVEDLAHGIYVTSSGMLTLDSVTLAPTGPYGGFVMAMGGELAIWDSTFSDLWGTQNPSVPLDGATWGGVIAQGATVSIYGATFTGCPSSALTLVNSDVYAIGIDISDAGAGFPGAVGMALLYQGTSAGDSHSLTINMSRIASTKSGTGVLLMLVDALGALDVSMNELNASNNAVHGLKVSMAGDLGPIDVAVSDSTMASNRGSGIALASTGSAQSGRSMTSVDLVRTVSSGNSAAGLLVDLSTSLPDLSVSMSDCRLEANSGPGLRMGLVDCSGDVSLGLDGVVLYDNTGDGGLVWVEPRPFSYLGTSYLPDLAVSVRLDSCDITDNMGNGWTEKVTTESLAPTSALGLHSYSLTASSTSFSSNTGNGLLIDEGPTNPLASPTWYFVGNRVSTYELTDCRLSDNGGAGLYISESIVAKDVVTNALDLTGCELDGNARGVEHMFALAFETTVHLHDCSLSDNTAESVYAHDKSGTQRFLGMEYVISGCTCTGPVRLNLGGAMIEPGASDREELRANVTIVDSILTSDYPLRLLLSAQYTASWAAKYLVPMRARVDIENNSIPSSSRSDGLYVELWGASTLDGVVTVKDMTFTDAGNDGVSVFMGVRATKPDHNRMIYGSVEMSDVTVSGAQRYGILVEAAAISDMMTVRGVLARLTDVKVSDVTFGARFDGADAELFGCAFSGVTLTTIEARDCTVDLRTTEFGALNEPNLRAIDSGSVRLWYDLDVTVTWKGGSEPVVGARVELIDNAFRTFGFGEVSSASAVTFHDLDAISVVAAGVFANNPYRLSISYLGLEQHRYVVVPSETSVAVLLVDDVPPILELRLPVDGTSQASGDIAVEGTALDVHRSIDRVLVSLDGSSWTTAQGTESFSLALQGLPDGPTVVRVRAYDTAGNWAEARAVVLIDTTPPSLRVISPADGLITSDPNLHLLAETDPGAHASIGGAPVVVTLTLIDATVHLVEGGNALTISVSDALGNSQQVVLTVTLDTQEPALAVLSPAHRSSVGATPVSVTGLTETSGITVTVGGIVVQVDAMGRFTASVALRPGRNDVPVEAVDTAGNSKLVTLTVFLDREPPFVRVLEPSVGAQLGSSTVTVAGFAEPGSTVFVGNRSVAVVDGQWSLQLALPEGSQVLKVMAHDVAGNVATVDVPVTVDTILPSLAVTTPSDGLLTGATSVTVRGTVSDAGPSGATVKVGGVAVTVAAGGSFSTTVTLVRWTNRIEVVATDAAGNVATVTLDVTCDPDRPFLNATAAGALRDAKTGASYVEAGTVLVVGFAEPGSTVRVNGVLVELDPVTGRYSLVVNLTAPRSGAPVATPISVVARDAAGNEATISMSVQSRPVTEEEAGPDTLGWNLLVLGLIILIVAIVLLVMAARKGRGPRADRSEGGEDQ